MSNGVTSGSIVYPKAAAARKNLLLYFVLASLHQLAPVCWWVPFNVEPRVETKFHGENSMADWCARRGGDEPLTLSTQLQFAATLFLVHFEGAATLFDFFLKAYFEPAEACTALVKTARKVRRRVSCRFSPTPPRRS